MEVPMAMGTTESGVGVEPGAAQLESMASSRSLPAGLVTRVRIVLLSAAGKMNQQIARQTAKGTVLTRCRQRHRHQEYLDFLQQIDNNVPPDLDVHVIVDNYATHKHPRVKRWLATRPRFHVHFTPTYASWLNQVEIWFHRITQRAIRRGTFRSVKELVTKIDQFVENDNQNARPFVWTATADSIFAKVQRLCERISGTGH
jgi:putative transposase